MRHVTARLRAAVFIVAFAALDREIRWAVDAGLPALLGTRAAAGCERRPRERRDERERDAAAAFHRAMSRIHCPSKRDASGGTVQLVIGAALTLNAP